jgi:hypothetical protein
VSEWATHSCKRIKSFLKDQHDNCKLPRHWRTVSDEIANGTFVRTF